MPPGTPAYVDLEPQDWRGLLARAAIFHAARTRLSDLSDFIGKPGVVQGVFNDLDLYVSQFAAADSDDETTVANVVHAWDAVLTQKLGMDQLDDAARQLLTEVQVLARCAIGADPIHDIFTGVSSKAQKLYGSAWRPPQLTVSHVRSHPRGAQVAHDPYVVSARTPWTGAGEASAVELLIFCDAFGPAAYAAVPILLIHECVCHVPARQQDEVKNDSPFAEGLLDWAAYFFLDMWATKIDAGLSIAARLHAQALRGVLTARTDTREGLARQIGHRGAETLRNWFEVEQDCDPDEAKAQVSRLAVALNQVDCPLSTKDHFVSRLCSPLPDDLAVVLKGWADNTLEAADLLTAGVRP